MTKSITVRSVETVHHGFYPKLVVRLCHDRFDGGTQEVSRDLLDLGPTAVVLPYDPERDLVVLVEQFRAAAWRLGDEPWMLEAVAGRCDPGEAPDRAARRETREEAGLTIGELVPVTTAYPSPGGLAERSAIFVGQADLSAPPRLGGHDPDEDIRIHVVPFDTAMAMISDGRLQALTAITALLWLALNRDGLRQRWSAMR